MGYFRELPDVEYQSFLSDAISSQDYLKVKNLFRRNKLRDDLQNVFAIFNKYEIVEGARPDTVAEEFYGKADLDWVVLMTAGIINVRDEWPLEHNDFNSYLLDKYLTEQNIASIHHHETIKIIDEEQKIVLNESLQVDSNFSFSFVGSVVSSSGSLKSSFQPRLGLHLLQA